LALFKRQNENGATIIQVTHSATSRRLMKLKAGWIVNE